MEKSAANMGIVLLSGRGNPALARALAGQMELNLGGTLLGAFPDGELNVSVQGEVWEKDVYVIQSTQDPVNDHILELLLLCDSCRRAGAFRLTAVIPYFGYARQDRRISRGEPVAARVVADLIAAHFDRIVTLDLHNSSIEGFFAVPLENLTAVPLLAEAIKPGLSEDTLIVSPDLGAVKLAQLYSDLLKLPVVYVHKTRETARSVQIQRIVGEVRDRPILLVDDIISTGATLFHAAKALLEKGCRPHFTLAATHALLVGDAAVKLAELPLAKMFVTDSVPLRAERRLPVEMVKLDRLFADAILRNKLT